MTASEVDVDRAFYAAVTTHFQQTVDSIPLPERRFFRTELDRQRLADLVPEAVPADEPSTGSGDEVQRVARSLQKARLRGQQKLSFSDVFVASFPPDQRQLLNCCFCRRFVDRYACLVAVNDATGTTRSLMWQVPLDQVPELYKRTVLLMKQAVEQAGVISEAFRNEPEPGYEQQAGDGADGAAGPAQALSWGLDHTTRKGDWYHLTIRQPPAIRIPRPIQSVEMQLLRDVLVEFPVPVVDAASALLTDSGTDATHRIARPDVFIDTLTWFSRAAHTYESFVQTLGPLDDETKDWRKKNLLWSLVVQAPGPSYTHLKNNMTGNLLQAVADNIDPQTKVLNKEAVVGCINDRMNTYREQTAGPSEQQLAHAKQFLQETGLIRSLAKQFALPDDIPEPQLIWKDNSPEKTPVPIPTEDIVVDDDPVSKAIAQVETVKKQKKTAAVKNEEQVVVDPGAIAISWNSFKDKVLPDAESIEVKWPQESDEKLFSLFSCADADAPALHKWGNNCSWSFRRGGLVPGETRRRVREAGGAVDNCPVRISLIWQTFDDLDLDVIAPSGKRIYFSVRKSDCGGELDTDANGMDKRTETPVENTRWFQTAPVGTYIVKVIAYAYHTEGRDPVDFSVEVEVDGVRYGFEGTAGKNGRHPHEEIQVATIVYRPAGVGSSTVTGHLAPANAPIWGLDRASFQPVREIFLLPNCWPPATPDAKVEKSSLPQILAFSVRGCNDVRETRAWYLETLRSDCRLHERSLSAIGRKIEIGRRQDLRKVCGIGENFDAPADWDTCVRVKSKGSSGTTLYRLDRPE